MSGIFKVAHEVIRTSGSGHEVVLINLRIHQFKDAGAELFEGAERDSCRIRNGFPVRFPAKNGFGRDAKKRSQSLLR